MPIHYAAEAGQTKFAEWLVDDKGQDIAAKTNNGAMAIHFAAKGVRLILPSG